jgi:hypothetical protein
MTDSQHNMSVKLDTKNYQLLIVVDGNSFPVTPNQSVWMKEQFSHQTERLRELMMKDRRIGAMRKLKRAEMNDSQRIKHDYYGEDVWVRAETEEAAHPDAFEWAE